MDNVSDTAEAFSDTAEAVSEDDKIKLMLMTGKPSFPQYLMRMRCFFHYLYLASSMWFMQ